MGITEQQLENLAIGWFRELGWEYVNRPDIAPDLGNRLRVDFRDVVLRERLLGALGRINPAIPVGALEQAVHELMTMSEQTDVWDMANQIQAYKEVYYAV